MNEQPIAEKDAAGRRGCVVPKRHPGDAAMCATSCWQERIGKGHCPAEPVPTAESTCPSCAHRLALHASTGCCQYGCSCRRARVTSPGGGRSPE